VAKIQRGNSLAAREPATVVNTGTPRGKGWDSDGRTDGWDAGKPSVVTSALICSRRSRRRRSSSSSSSGEGLSRIDYFANRSVETTLSYRVKQTVDILCY